MDFAKLIDGDIFFAPRKLTIGEFVVYNPTQEMLTDAGYKPVRYTDPPEIPDGYTANSFWVEEMVDTELVIYQHWQIELAPITEEEALVRYANELMGQQDGTLTEATETLIKNYMEVN